MGDGEYDATLGRRRTPGTCGSTSPEPTLRPAPWERFCEPERDDAVHRWQAEPSIIESAAPPIEPPVEPHTGGDEAGGCHTTGGVSVADLIAKVGAPATRRPSHHHLAPDPTVEPEIPIALQDTQVIDTPAYSLDAVSELPEFADPDDPTVGESEFPHSRASPQRHRGNGRFCSPRAR